MHRPKILLSLESSAGIYYPSDLKNWFLRLWTFGGSGKYLLNWTCIGHSNRTCISVLIFLGQKVHANLCHASEKRCRWTLIWDTPPLWTAVQEHFCKHPSKENQHMFLFQNSSCNLCTLIAFHLILWLYHTKREREREREREKIKIEKKKKKKK